MKLQFILSTFCSIGLLLVSATANAQRFETQQLNQRISELEREINTLRNNGNGSNTAPLTNAGQISAEMMRIEEQMRFIRGAQERLDFRLDKIESNQKSFAEDIEFRLREMSDSGGPNGEPMMVTPPPAMTNSSQTTDTQNATAAYQNDISNQPFTSPAVVMPQTSSNIGINTAPLPPAMPAPPAPLANEYQTSPPPSQLPQQNLGEVSPNDPATPRGLYNLGFQLLNKTDYVGAEDHFSRFTQQFPDDPLIGNAWYWLGETYYVRRNYVQAADSFRQGFEAMEQGPKAGDNLLKLAMSLSALEKDKESCVVLKQVEAKYAGNSDSLKTKTSQEMNRLGC